MTEEQMRKTDICEGCKSCKVIGTIVCWNCYKYRRDITPLKYFNGSVFEWLQFYKLS